MAGPDYIHVRDSDAIVQGVFSNSRTPLTGHTEYNETHPVFLPSVTTTRWERQGVNTYVNIGVSILPDDEDKEFMTWVMSGGMEAIPEDGDTAAAWGHEESLAGVTMFRDGRCVGFSVSYEGSFSGGTLQFFMTINGVKQNGVGQTITLTPSSLSDFIQLDPAIEFDQGDIVSMISTAVSKTGESGGDDCTLTMWYTDR
jgi:hypothetical protein